MTLRLVAVLAVVVAVPALGQAPGLPVVNSGVARGVTIGAMIGFPNEAAGDGTGYGAHATIGFRRFAVGGLVAALDGEGETVKSFGGNVTFKVLGGPLVPVAVNLQAGAARSSFDLGAGLDDLTRWHVPVGLGISWTFPQPVVALRPWIAPRLDYVRATGPNPLGGGQITEDDTNFGLSAGITLGFLNGLAIDLAFDRVFGGEAGSKPATLGIGASINLK